MDQQTQPQQFAIVSMYGHQRVAGAISEQSIAGASFLRVDIPAVEVETSEWGGEEYSTAKRTIPAHSKLLGSNAVFCIDPCDEATAMAAAMSIRHEPVDPNAVARALRRLPEPLRDRLLAMTPSAALLPAAAPASADADGIPY